ncbi:MAG: DUF2512 family protein [Bacillota bacterium]
MTGLLMKLVICPVTLLISDVLFNGVNYYNIYQPIIVGIVLAVAAHMMELLLLRKGTLRMSNIADFIAAFAIVYLSQFLLPFAAVTFTGALFTAALLTITEHFQHLYLIKSGKTRKTA